MKLRPLAIFGRDTCVYALYVTKLLLASGDESRLGETQSRSVQITLAGGHTFTTEAPLSEPKKLVHNLAARVTLRPVCPHM